MVKRNKITASWEIFAHVDYPQCIIGQAPYKATNQYAQVWTLARENIRLVLVTDDTTITQKEAVAFARSLMDGSMIGKKVGMNDDN